MGDPALDESDRAAPHGVTRLSFVPDTGVLPVPQFANPRHAPALSSSHSVFSVDDDALPGLKKARCVVDVSAYVSRVVPCDAPTASGYGYSLGRAVGIMKPA